MRTIPGFLHVALGVLALAPPIASAHPGHDPSLHGMTHAADSADPAAALAVAGGVVAFVAGIAWLRAHHRARSPGRLRTRERR